MTSLQGFAPSCRSVSIVFCIWIGCAASAVVSAFYVRGIPLQIAAVWLLLTAGMILWTFIGLVDRLRGITSANDEASSADRKFSGGRAFRTAVSLWTIVTGFYCLGALVDDGTWFLIAFAAIPVVVFWMSVVVWAIGLTAVRLWQCAYGPALRAALIPALGTIAFLHGQYIGDIARFELERASYVATITALRAGGEHDDRVEVDLGPPMVAYFLWGGMIWTSYGVVFDETDQVAKPTAVRRAAWAGRDVPTELTCEGDALPVGGHFYVGRFAC